MSPWTGAFEKLQEVQILQSFGKMDAGFLWAKLRREKFETQIAQIIAEGWGFLESAKI